MDCKIELNKKASGLFVVPTLLHKRSVSIDEQQALAKVTALAFGMEIDPKIIQRIVQYISYIENKMTGRMASHVEDLVIYYLMSYCSSFTELEKDKNPVHLELGTISGGATILSHHAFSLAEKDISIHAVDIVDNLQNDLAALNVSQKDVHVHQGHSSDPTIREVCQTFHLSSLFIEGNHTYDEVRNDWLLYSPLVVSSGYVLIHNYNNSAYPGTTSYVNKMILPNLQGEWEVVLIYANSIILRKCKSLNCDHNSNLQKISTQFLIQERKLSELEKKYIIKDVVGINICKELEYYRSELQNEQEKVADIKKLVNEQKESMQKLEVALEKSTRQARKNATEKKLLKRQVGEKQEMIDAILTSISWRIGEPARKLIKLIRWK